MSKNEGSNTEAGVEPRPSPAINLPVISRRLAEKCARAKALMEEAASLVEEVLEDHAYRPGVLPPGVVPSGVDDYLQDAIAMLEEEPGDGPGEACAMLAQVIRLPTRGSHT